MGMSSPKALLYVRIFEFGQSGQNIMVFIVIFSCESSITYEHATSVLLWQLDKDLFKCMLQFYQYLEGSHNIIRCTNLVLSILEGLHGKLGYAVTSRSWL